MKTHANESLLGQLLNGRYQVIKVLSAGAFGQTYIAEDTSLIGIPQRVVKHLKPNASHPRQWQICKRLFASEAVILEKLGKHDQIVQLLDCFEDEQGFYLVQEWIVGEPLSGQLPLSQHCDKRWSEEQCVAMLDDVLGILEFVHGCEVIHCDLKPNNLIRRSSDGRLVLIDFGVARAISPTLLKQPIAPVYLPAASELFRPMGYISAEQFSGQPRFNSDLYALGAIALEALTGLSPMQIQADPDTGEIAWEHLVSVSQPLGYVLNRMVRYRSEDRYQSAADARAALRRLMINSEDEKPENDEVSDYLPIVPLPIAPAATELLNLCLHRVSPLADNNSSPLSALPGTAEDESGSSKLDRSYYAREIAKACLPKLPPLLSGMGVGIATSNALAISFGLYTLLHTAPANPEFELLTRAMEQYQAGNFDEAIALAKSIPRNSSAYKESVATVRQWRSEWNEAAAGFQAVERAFHEQQWQKVLEAAEKTPNIAAWQRKIEPYVRDAKSELETQARQLWQQAYEKASEKDFSAALSLLKQIHPDTPSGAKIKPKLVEYSQKQQIKAESLLQKAFDRAGERDFSGALEYLAQISQETPTYKTAQIKIAEYSQKQHFQEEVERQVELARAATNPKRRYSETSSAEPFRTEPFIKSDTKTTNSELNPGGQFQEVSPKLVRGTPLRR